MHLIAALADSRQKTARIMSCAFALVTLFATSGCIQRIWERDDDAADRMQNAPLLMLDSVDQHQLIVMQAPSPGWSVRLDATKRTPEGKRVFITIREPDPAYEYTQQIVLMRVLTRVKLDTEIEVVGRMLDHDQRTKGRGYAPVTVVGSFE